MSTGLKGLHDRLVSRMPPGAEHSGDTCPLCALEAELDGGILDYEPRGGSMSDKVFSEEDLKAAVDKAVAEATSPLQTKLTELENSQQQSEMDKAVAAAKAEAEAQVAEMQTKLDAAVVEKNAAIEAKEALEVSLREAAEKAEQEKLLAARREERLAKVDEFGEKTKKHVEDNIDRFVAMSDEEFDERLEEWRTLAKKADIPDETRLVAWRTPSTKSTSALSAVLDLRRAGIDPRRVRS